MGRPRSPWFAIVLALASAMALSFLFLPVLAIFVNTDVGRLVSSLGSSESTDALRLSLETTAIAVAVIAVVGAFAVNSADWAAMLIWRTGRSAAFAPEMHPYAFANSNAK